MKDYVHAAKRYPWLFEAVESAITALPAGVLTNGRRLLKGIRASNGRPISDSEALIALNALSDLGIVERQGSHYCLNKQRLCDTDQLRHGIRSAIAILEGGSNPTQTETQLCVSLPPSLAPAIEHVIRESSTDLRSGMLDVIASARQSLLIASPFWDAGTSEEIAKLAKKKLSVGVKVTLLGRFGHEMPAPVRGELGKIAKHSNCHILSWFEASGNETQTFHFKAISADTGLKAYLGSANMTISSLRSRMEFGVILTGKVATELDRVLRVVVTLASTAPL